MSPYCTCNLHLAKPFGADHHEVHCSFALFLRLPSCGLLTSSRRLRRKRQCRRALGLLEQLCSIFFVLAAGIMQMMRGNMYKLKAARPPDVAVGPTRGTISVTPRDARKDEKGLAAVYFERLFFPTTRISQLLPPTFICRAMAKNGYPNICHSKVTHTYVTLKPLPASNLNQT